MIWDNGQALLKANRRRNFMKGLIHKAVCLSYAAIISCVACGFAVLYGDIALAVQFFNVATALVIVAALLIVWRLCL